MLPIRGLYEVALKVKHLPTAEAFYRNVLGLQVGLRDEKRNWVFLRVGGEAGMIVLQEEQGQWPIQHAAFTVDEQGMEEAITRLQEHGVKLDGPYVHEWMPAKSLYFADPDGNDLELCAPLKRN